MHLEPVSSDEEELPVPITSVPIPAVPQVSNEISIPIGVSQPAPDSSTTVPGIINMHVSTVSPPLSTLVPPPQSLPQIVPTPSLSPADWSALISKAQTDGLPHAVPLTSVPMPQSPVLSDPLPLSKIFTVESSCFSLDPEPGAIPDCLLQMALNRVFIPLSMLTTVALNNIEINQDMKYKCLTNGSGMGKTFLDKCSFPSEDQLSDFEFSQAYTNWLMLIESVSEPTISLGWWAHHKQMISDRGFVEWALMWRTHDRLLHLCFMQKPFILDVS